METRDQVIAEFKARAAKLMEMHQAEALLPQPQAWVIMAPVGMPLKLETDGDRLISASVTNMENATRLPRLRALGFAAMCSDGNAGVCVAMTVTSALDLQIGNIQECVDTLTRK